MRLIDADHKEETVEAIPIEWVKEYARFLGVALQNMDSERLILNMIECWEKQNEQTNSRT